MSENKRIPNKISYIRKGDAIVLGAVFLLLITLIMGISVTVEHYKETQRVRVQETMDVVSENHK